MGFLKNFKRYIGLEPSFRGVMAQVVEHCDLEVQHADHDSCMARIPYRRVKVECFVMIHGDDTVTFSFHSSYRFPRGQLPASVCRMLEKCNRDLERCQYGSMTTRRGSFFMVKSAMDFSEFNAGTFAVAAREMVPLLVKLDDFLEVEGFVE